MLFFVREATGEIYGPRVSSLLYLPSRSTFICFYFQIYISKNPKIPCCNLLFFILSPVPTRSIYPNYYKIIYPFTREGLTTPPLRLVVSICYLCVDADHVVLLGSPTSSITLVSSLRKYLPLMCYIIPSYLGKYRRSTSEHQKEFLAPLLGRHHQHLPGS